MSKNKTIKVMQIASPIGRQAYQKKCLIGLGLNKINRTKVLPYNDSIFGMVKKVKHLVKYEIME
ncbi:50S ribosomal protein L30 [Alphaproteobacteria bacterium]|nr:50S ribosomal protein L30 [Alphaproteobacteria bacterium]